MGLKTWRKNITRMLKAWHLREHMDVLHSAFGERDNRLLAKHELELMENALVFGQMVADEISVPRADIVAVPENANFAKVMKAFAKSAHSRLPVMGKDLDDVKGLVNLKDVVEFLGKEDQFKLAQIVRPVTLVPETMPLPRILQMMRRSRVPLVLVADEFGGTSGLISLKDILEQLVGDIDDEHEESEDSPLVALGDGRFRVQGDYTLEDFDTTVGTKLFEAFGENVETMSGAVLQAAQRVPAKGDKVTLMPRVEATVLAGDGRRVLMVEIQVG